MDWFSDFQIRVNCTFTQNCLCMKPKREQLKNECFCSPSIFADQQFVRKAAAGLLPKFWDSRSQRCHEFTCKLYAWTSANSGGSGVLGCLLSKCCLKVLGSGICVLQTVQVYIKAALAAAFWSCPCFFFCPACFLAFFCWDWIFCCPRAISGPGQSCVGEAAQREGRGKWP